MTDPITRTDVRTSIGEKLAGRDKTAGVARPKDQPEPKAQGDEQAAEGGTKEDK